MQSYGKIANQQWISIPKASEFVVLVLNSLLVLILLKDGLRADEGLTSKGPSLLPMLKGIKEPFSDSGLNKEFVI
jgi:hypothetical protein